VVTKEKKANEKRLHLYRNTKRNKKNTRKPKITAAKGGVCAGLCALGMGGVLLARGGGRVGGGEGGAQGRAGVGGREGGWGWWVVSGDVTFVWRLGALFGGWGEVGSWGRGGTIRDKMHFRRSAK